MPLLHSLQKGYKGGLWLEIAQISSDTAMCSPPHANETLAMYCGSITALSNTGLSFPVLLGLLTAFLPSAYKQSSLCLPSAP